MKWAYFQLALLGVAAGILLVRIVWLRRKTGIHFMKIGHPSEAGFVLGECVMVALILRTTGFIPFSLPAVLELQVIASEAMRWIGGSLMITGLGVFAAALISMGTSWRIGIDRQTPGTLVTTGIFRRSRNPIFLFLDVYVIGTFLLNGTVVFLIAVVLTAAFLHAQILREERFLSGQYGDAYRQYCSRVPRYF